MKRITFKSKTFQVDDLGFLLDYKSWGPEFAEGLASSHGIKGGLGKKHWEVIEFIRNTLEEFGRCPLVYQTCKMNDLKLKDLRELFPTGYLRGACKLAGLTYKEGYLKHYTYLPIHEEVEVAEEKTYTIDVRGFLVNPSEWDEQFAIYRAHDLKMPEVLTEMHWKIIHFLRDYHKKNGTVPTIYDTCEKFNLEIDEFGKLFPDGYHRGAVKLAGLKVR